VSSTLTCPISHCFYTFCFYTFPFTNAKKINLDTGTYESAIREEIKKEIKELEKELEDLNN
jgi:hypothetical protein